MFERVASLIKSVLRKRETLNASEIEAISNKSILLPYIEIIDSEKNGYITAEDELVLYLKIHKKLSSEEWHGVCQHIKLSEEFMSKHIKHLNWNTICLFQSLTEDFIRKNKNRVDWDSISQNQKFSKEFLIEFKHKINWGIMIINDNIPSEISENIKEFGKKYCPSYGNPLHLLDGIKNKDE